MTIVEILRSFQIALEKAEPSQISITFSNLCVNDAKDLISFLRNETPLTFVEKFSTKTGKKVKSLKAGMRVDVKASGGNSYADYTLGISLGNAIGKPIMEFIPKKYLEKRLDHYNLGQFSGYNYLKIHECFDFPI